MPSYSYKVRVLAVVDSIAPGPIQLKTIEDEVQITSKANKTPLPSSWRKWMKITLDKLVEEGWLLNDGDNYTTAASLRARIKEEKKRLNVQAGDHQWATFAVIARRLPNTAANIPSTPSASPTTPVTRASKRRSEAITVEVPDGATPQETRTREENGTIVVREDSQPDKEAKRRRLRYSDPGITAPQTSSQRRKSTITPSSQPHPRRKSTGPSRTNRRHTIAAPSQVPPQMREIAQGVSKEIQFIPLRQVLSARTKRALRRNHLSEEMNDIHDERRALQRKNREELARVRAELERGRQQIEDLRRELHAARMAPPSETGSIGPGSVGMAPIYEDDAEEAFSPPVFGSLNTPRTPFRFNMGNTLTPALRRFQSENQREPGETPISRRDKKIKALENQIEQLRQDILDREEEEQRRAEEEEIYREAQEQILMEAMDTSQADMSFMPSRNTSFSEARDRSVTPTTTKNKPKVSFAEEDSEEEFTPMLPAEDDDDYDGFQVSIVDSSNDLDEIHAPPRTRTPTPAPITEITQQAISITTVSSAPQFEQENETLKAAIEILKQRVEQLEQDLENSNARPEERAFGVQTDFVTDTEKIKLKEMIEALEDKAEVLEQSSLEERHRLWQKIRGHISEAHNYEGVEELDMAIDEILTNLSLAQNTADEHYKAFEAAERDLKVERMLAEEKVAEISGLVAERDSLLEQVEKLEEIKSGLEEQIAGFEADEERLERELENQKKELFTEHQELEMKSNELEAAVAEAEKLERDLTDLGDVIDDEIAQFPNAPSGPLTTILEKLQAYAEVVKEERETQRMKLDELLEDIAEKEQSLAELRDSLATLDQKHEDLEAINRKQLSLLEQKDKEIQELTQELASIKEQLEEVQKTNDMLNGVIASKNEKITSLTDQLTWLTTDLAKIKEKRDEAQKQVAELSSELEKKTEETRAQGIKLDLDLSGKSQMIAALETQLASVNEQLSSLNEQYNAKELEVAELSNELVRTKEEAEAQLAALNEELDTKNEKIVGLEGDVDNLSEEIQELKTTVEQLNTDQVNKVAKIEELNNQVKEKQQAIADLEALHEVIKIKNKTIEEMEVQMHGLGTRLDEKSELLTSATSDLAVLRENVIEKDEAIVLLEEEIADLKDDAANLRQELDLLQNHETQLNATLADKDERVEELSEEITDINNIIEEKSSEAENLKAEVVSLNSGILEREEQIRALQSEIEGLNERLEASLAKVEELEENICDLQDRNETKDNAIDELHDNITTLNRTIAERDDAIATLNRDVSDRNGVIQVNSGTIKSLTNKVDDLNNILQARDELVVSLKEDIVELNEQIFSLNSDLASLQEQRTSADERIKSLMDDIAQKDERIAELEKLYDVIAAKNTEIDSLTDALDDLRSQFSALTERYSAAEAKIEELLEEVSRNQKTIHQLEADLDSSILRETETNKRYTDALAVQEGLKEQVNQMHTEMENLKSVIIGHEVALEEKEEEITVLQQKYTDLETQMRKQIASHSEQLTELRAELEQEREEAVNELQSKLQQALEDKADLEADLQSTMSEYKDIVARLESKIEEVETKLEESQSETKQAIADMHSLQEAKDALIADLEEKVREIAQAKEKSEEEFEEQIERKRMALVEKEKELVDVELTAQKEKHDLKVELNKQYEHISRLEDTISDLDERLQDSHDEEVRLEDEIADYEQSMQLLKEDAAKVKTALENTNQELGKEIDALRLELLNARDELKQEIEVHANSINEKNSAIASLNEIIDGYREEGISLKKRISALTVASEKWRQKYNRAIEDSTAEFDAIQNNLWKIASTVKDRKADFLQRSDSRLLAQDEDEDEEEQLQIEDSHEGASTAGGLMSPDATTNVSLASPPTPESSQHFAPLSSRIMGLTQTHSKKRRFDSGIGVDDEEEEEIRFSQYGSQRRGFLTEEH